MNTPLGDRILFRFAPFGTFAATMLISVKILAGLQLVGKNVE